LRSGCLQSLSGGWGEAFIDDAVIGYNDPEAIRFLMRRAG
jgi:hypothetical protein